MDIISDKMTGFFQVTRDDAGRCADRVARTGDQGTLVGMKRVASDVDVAGICAKGLHNVSGDEVESCVWIED
jgi:hypothetical protein